jgi:hypothetical protein
MITPTRTVCYAIPEEDAEQKLKVTYASPVGLTVEYSKGLCGLLDYSEVRRIIVREEPVEQYHPLMFHASELPAIEIKPGHIMRYLMCNKSLNPLNPCDCGDCDKVLASYSKIKEAPQS